MKKFMFLGVFWFIMCGAVSAQSPLTELDKIKQIKFLESTREDVRRIFAGYKESNARVDASNFETKFLRFNIFYSTGNCAAEDEDWNMPEGKVTSIMIFFKKSFKPEDLGVDLSSLRKEKIFTDSSEDFVYHDKNIGVSYSTCNGEIHSMDIFPPKNNYPFVCNKQSIKKFYQNNRWSDEKTKNLS